MSRLPSLVSACLGALAPAAALASVGQPPTGSIIGIWATEDNEAHVEICERDGRFHGTFVWFQSEPQHNGLDIKNPDPTRRNQLLLGTDFIRNFEFDDGKWRHGRIYNPDNGKQYKADLELGDGALKVRGWIGFRWLGRTVQWTRVPAARPSGVSCLR